MAARLFRSPILHWGKSKLPTETSMMPGFWTLSESLWGRNQSQNIEREGTRKITISQKTGGKAKKRVGKIRRGRKTLWGVQGKKKSQKRP